MIGILWQDTETKDFEKLLDIAIEYFNKKMGFNPETTFVNVNIKIKEHNGIDIRKDKYLYSESLIWMIIKTEKEN